jgi:glutaredoxin-related protein
MRIRFFGSPECYDCLKIFILLNKINIEYDYIDVTNEKKEVQIFCDEQNVDQLPHLQFIDDNDNIVIEHIGTIDEENLIIYINNYFISS